MAARKIIDASRLEGDRTLAADVAIIGTGAGGGVSAEILAQAGLAVVMIEEGGYFRAKDFTLEERQAYPDLYQDSAARKTKDKAITLLQGRAVGGSTTVNWTSSFRTPPETLEHWAAAHGVEGLGAGDLAPWFARMEKRLDIASWETPANANNDALARGATKLGWRVGTMRRNVRNCLDLGYCGLGCPVDAKQSMLVTTIPAALERGAQLVTRARAERLEIANGRVRAVHCLAMDARGLRPTGPRIRVEAKRVVLAGGALNSPAVLMRSRAPDAHGALGKRTFLHPTNVSLALMDATIEGWRGAPQSVYSDQFLWRDGVAGRLGYKLEVPPLYPLMGATVPKLHGRAHSALFADFPRSHVQIALMRDGFHDESPGGQVTLRDDGSPVLDYPLNDYHWDGARRAFLSMAEAQFAAGAKTVLPVHLDARPYGSWREARAAIGELPMEALRATLFSAHLMGGCAMGEDPRSAVVDSRGRHHQVAGLSVFDGSVFPTSLGVNPQLSIYGLVARWATALATEARG